MKDLVAIAPVELRVAEIVRPLVEKMGFVLVRLRYGGGARKTLQIMAERPDGSMEVDDCAEISRAVSAALDVDDPLDGPYSLEVSSPGIDRPLTRLSDFEAFAGRRAKIQLLDQIDGRSRFKGVVGGVADEEILLETPKARSDCRSIPCRAQASFFKTSSSRAEACGPPERASRINEGNAMNIASANRLELLRIAEAVAQEKMIEREIVIEAMEESMAKAAKMRYGTELDIRAHLDRGTGDLTLTRVRTVVEEVENQFQEITPKDAAAEKPDAEVGDELVDELPPLEMGRIAAQSAKQVICKRCATPSASASTRNSRIESARSS